MLPRNPLASLLIAASALTLLSCSESDAPDAPAASQPAPEGCVSDASAGHHVFTCDEIAFDVEVPPACLTQACGLILDVHGFSMSAAMEDASTELRRRGRERGYIVVQPSATPAPPLASWDANGADDEAVFATLQRVSRVWRTDPKRVHVTGFSQGGNMTWRLLCKHADALASVAPAAFSGGCPFDSGGQPSREVPILYMHGEDDGLVPFEGAVEQRDRIVAAWKMDAGQKTAGDGAFERTRHTSPSGTVFEFLTHRYAVTEKCLVADIKGHCFPGSTDPGTAPGQACSFACPAPNAFHWGEELMRFFEEHPGR